MLTRISAFFEEQRREKMLRETARALQVSEFKGQSVDYIMNLIRGGEFDASTRA